MTHLFQVGIWRHTDDPTSHNLADRLPLFANDIVLGHHTHHYTLSVHNGQTADTMLCDQPCRLLFGMLFRDGNHPGGHDILCFHAYTSFFCASSSTVTLCSQYSTSRQFRCQTPTLWRTPQAGERQLADEQQFLRQPVVQLHKQLLVREQFLLPEVAVYRHQLAKTLA